MQKTIWIKKQGGLYVMTAGDESASIVTSSAVRWGSIEYRLGTLGFSHTIIAGAKAKLDGGEAAVMLTVV